MLFIKQVFRKDLGPLASPFLIELSNIADLIPPSFYKFHFALMDSVALKCDFRTTFKKRASQAKNRKWTFLDKPLEKPWAGLVFRNRHQPGPSLFIESGQKRHGINALRKVILASPVTFASFLMYLLFGYFDSICQSLCLNFSKFCLFSKFPVRQQCFEKKKRKENHFNV